MRNRIIAVIFLCFLLFFGVRTGMNVWDSINGTERSHRPQTEALGSNGQISGFNKESLEEISNTITLNLANRNQWINLNGMFQKGMGKTADLEKDWYRLENGMLMYSLRKDSPEDLHKYADNVVELSRYVKKHGKNFLYVELPYKVQDEDEYPAGVPEYGNPNADEILKVLSSKSVHRMDVRDIMKDKNMKSTDSFFRTDQHWKPEIALWAAGEISKKLSQVDSEWKDHPEYRNLNNYRKEHYSDLFLGAIGKKIGSAYAGMDDFDMLIPKFDNQFRYCMPKEKKTVERTGNFKTAFIVPENLEKDPFRVNTYAAYCGGDHPRECVTNEKVKNNRHILLIRDSFSCALMPYLSLYTKNVTTLDLRHYKTESLYDYIRNHPEIDTVIVAYNPSAITEIQYTFDKVVK
ncbi:DHHW family protein [Mogibacterium kristiansenii]|uniref:DHHW family protein n=1 Tax=Mogibacterium kristiansenii TaxID=2606708 RepID=UPI002409E5A2|nr:DHHW family protein [Mogibacterium kristiansenii]MDD6700945.1 hypothetical protein [Mogibacterium kristiansenii]